MNPLLVSGFGTSINVEKSKLIIQNKLKNKRYEFYPHKINHDSIILDSHTGNITFNGIKWLMKHDIQLTILNWNGNLLGVTLPENPKSGQLRIKQYEKYCNNKIRFFVAQKIVEKKIDGSFNLIKSLSNYYSIDLIKIKKQFESEKNNYLIKIKDKPTDFTTLLTYEGRIAQVYFDVLGTIFAQTGTKFQFSGRKRADYSRNYNATDEINALFNYGYAILESEIRKIINSIGFDPGIGFLHEVLPSRTPLVYDFQELFRWIIDLSVLQTLENYPKLKKSDFVLTENYNIRLKDTAATLLIDKIKDNLNKKVKYRGKNYYYSNILYDNITKLAHFISEKNKNLEFVVPEMVFARNDLLTLQQKILNMTPSERKRLGINKSTLHYMKKNLKSRKNIKIYGKVLNKLNN